MIDLHVHSTFSDGTLTPTQLVEHAMENHLTAFALTDHDTVDGLGEAFQAAEDKPIKVISGIEFSTEYNEMCIRDSMSYDPYIRIMIHSHGAIHP